MHPLNHPPACTYSRLLDDFLCFPETWEKTTVGIQMAKNSPGASLQTQESAQCSAPTSLNVAPKISPVVRDSAALSHSKQQGKSLFSLHLKQRNILHFHDYVDRGVHMRPCNHTYCNHFVSVPAEKCSPIGLWEGLTTMPHINKFWQQLGIVSSHWTVKDGVEGFVLDKILSGLARDSKSKRCRSMAEYTNANFPRDFRNISFRWYGFAFGIIKPLWGCVVVCPWGLNIFPHRNEMQGDSQHRILHYARGFLLHCGQLPCVPSSRPTYFRSSDDHYSSEIRSCLYFSAYNWQVLSYFNSR